TSMSSLPSVTTSRIAATFGCRIRAASRASSRNMVTKSGSFASIGNRHFTATVRANPAGPSTRPKCTDAIPPDAISSNTRYRPTVRMSALALRSQDLEIAPRDAGSRCRARDVATVRREHALDVRALECVDDALLGRRERKVRVQDL